MGSCDILPHVADIVVPPQWKRLGEEDLRGTVMVVGASDTGKSTLARFLYEESCRRGLRSAYLDADMGQSTLGVPTTLNLALAGEAGDACFPPQGPRAAYFVGAVTPRGHMLPTVIGAHRLQQRALSLGADAIVVDTTGLVDQVQGGKALKQWKIELLAPGVVVALQRRRELESILWPLRRDGRVRCVELPVSPYVVARSRETRIARRRERLAHYFENAQPRLVNMRQTAIYDLEHLAIGGLVAFQDADGFLVGLGVVEEVDRLAGTVIARTPLPDLEGVASVRFGAARLDPAMHKCFAA
ncbi:MAG TPA: Clp1/GlmU family protein [Anaerolineae bacterium]|nr:Clp1/GlmU family protein [Anaerolineae bacterium]